MDGIELDLERTNVRENAKLVVETSEIWIVEIKVAEGED